MGINQINRLAHLSGDMDQHPVTREGCIQRGQWALNWRLAVLFQRTIEITRPMQITVRRREPFDADAF